MTKPIILHAFSPAFSIPDPSPFPIKVMMFMRMHSLEFDTVPGDPRKAPLKKIPYLSHNNKKIPDSELILNYLEKEFNLSDIELSEEQHAQGHFLCRALEERTYWVVVHLRWFGEKSAPIMKDLLLASVPKSIRGLVFRMVQKKIKASIDGHGLGRHSDATKIEFMRADYRALSAFLGDKDYLFGAEPSRYDCSAVAAVAMLAAEWLPIAAPNFLDEFPNLKAYWERAKAAYFKN